MVPRTSLEPPLSSSNTGSGTYSCGTGRLAPRSQYLMETVPQGVGLRPLCHFRGSLLPSSCLRELGLPIPKGEVAFLSFMMTSEETTSQSNANSSRFQIKAYNPTLINEARGVHWLSSQWKASILLLLGVSSTRVLNFFVF